MKIYAISDLHLDSTNSKPMDIFSDAWSGQKEKILASQKRLGISDDDVILICGDLSWALKLSDAITDFEFLKKLNGKKIIIKGNHDYWWSSVTALRAALPQNVFAIQNDALHIGNYIFCGTRGWQWEAKETQEQNKKLTERELIRLKLSLDAAQKIYDIQCIMYNEGKIEKIPEIICMLHYPPFTKRLEDTEFTKLIEAYKIRTVVYGHLHGKYHKNQMLITKNEVSYYLTSCDVLESNISEIKV